MFTKFDTQTKNSTLVGQTWVPTIKVLSSKSSEENLNIKSLSFSNRSYSYDFEKFQAFFDNFSTMLDHSSNSYENFQLILAHMLK